MYEDDTAFLGPLRRVYAFHLIKLEKYIVKNGKKRKEKYSRIYRSAGHPVISLSFSFMRTYNYSELPVTRTSRGPKEMVRLERRSR